jgi:hypothetical protein
VELIYAFTKESSVEITPTRMTHSRGRSSWSSSVCSLPLIHSSLSDSFLVSQDPANYNDAPTEGIRRVLEVVTGESIPRGEKLDITKIGELSDLWLDS